MHARIAVLLTPALFFLVTASPAASAQNTYALDVEAGAVFAGYNDVRIPGDDGTKISLTDDLETDPAAYFRTRISWANPRGHNLALTAAPLVLEAEGSVDKPVRFDDITFPAGTPLKARYQFNSYRLTYRYDFHRAPTLRAGVGLTAFVRDASVRVEGGGLEDESANVGLVPLLNFNVEWMPAGRWALVLNGDAMAAPQGRAGDVLLALRYAVSPVADLQVGYRIIEGGADNDEVYSFAALHHVGIGATLKF